MFMTDYEKCMKGDYDGWINDRDGVLAALILLDQFTRQFFRGQGRAFEADPKAQQITLKLITEERYNQYKAFEKLFILLPLMHAEDINCLVKCTAELTKVNEDLKSRYPEFIVLGQPYLEINLQGSHDHEDTIRKFGRYPYRNQCLGRESTPEEIEYLGSANTYGQ